MTISTMKQFHTCTMSKGKLAKLKLEEGLSEVTDAEELKKEIADLLEHNGRVYGIYRRKELVGVYLYERQEDYFIKTDSGVILGGREFDFDKFVWRMAATTACRMSVMANEYISLEEQQWILDNIRKCENPFTCPHGRPTIITDTKYDLEKLFKRSLD